MFKVNNNNTKVTSKVGGWERRYNGYNKLYDLTFE